MTLLKRKVFKLMRVFKPKMENYIKESTEKYHIDFLESFKTLDNLEGDQHEVKNIDEEMLEFKASNVPTSKQIKAMSVKVLENVKREEDA